MQKTRIYIIESFELKTVFNSLCFRPDVKVDRNVGWMHSKILICLLARCFTFLHEKVWPLCFKALKRECLLLFATFTDKPRTCFGDRM